MKQLALTAVLALLAPLSGGMIHIDSLCPPEKIHIVIRDDHNKVLIDHTLVSPKDKTPLVIQLDPTRKHRFRVETSPPGVRCSFKGAQGDVLPPEPDLECVCLQNSDQNRSGINVQPGKWMFTSRTEFHGPLPMAVPPQTNTECIRDPQRYFSVDNVSAIEGEADCPYTSKVQTYDYGSWERGGICSDKGVYKGEIRYYGDRIEETLTVGNPSNEIAVIHISGKRIGDCD